MKTKFKEMRVQITPQAEEKLAVMALKKRSEKISKSRLAGMLLEEVLVKATKK